MSDKNSESFEEWCKANGFCSSFVPEKAWNHQQKKIDELKKLFKDQGGCIVSAMSLLGKLQAAEENLTECAANYWKEVETRKAAEEEIKTLKTLNARLFSENGELSERIESLDKVIEQSKFLLQRDYSGRWVNGVFLSSKQAALVLCEYYEQALEKIASDEAGKEQE